MLAAGIKSTTGQVCLRCQLRSVLSHLRGSHPNPIRRLSAYNAHCRSFSALPFSRQAENATLSADKPGVSEEEGSRLRIIRYGGPAASKEGRKEKGRYETLGIDSLGSRTNVILLHDNYNSDAAPRKSDVEDDEHAVKSKPLDVDAIEAEISGQAIPPDEEEVHASINAMRPGNAVLEQEDYDHMLKELTERYNQRQLSKYLAHYKPTGGGNVSREDQDKIIPWRYGGQHDQSRPKTASKKVSRGSKSSLAEQILGSVWCVSLHAQEQAIGELGLHVRPEQLKLLCDYNSDEGKPKWQSLLSSPLLARSIEVRPKRSSKLLRIIGRRQDAEQVAKELSERLLDTESMLVKTSQFKPLGGKHGWPDSFDLLFPPDVLQEIQTETQVVLSLQNSGDVLLHAIDNDHALRARRHLYNHIDLDSAKTKKFVIKPLNSESSPRMKQGGTRLPFFAGSSLHGRDRHRNLARLAYPIRSSALGSTERYSGRPRDPGLEHADLISRIRDVSAYPQFTALEQANVEDGNDLWDTSERQVSLEQWEAQLGYVLHNHSTKPFALTTKEGITQRHQLTYGLFVSRVPAFDRIMSYFAPLPYEEHRTHSRPRDYREHWLHAHFTPSPISSTSTKHDVEAILTQPSFDFVFRYLPRTKSRPSSIMFHALRTTFQHHNILIPRPQSTLDLRLKRRVELKPGPATSLADDLLSQKAVAEFIGQLERNAQHFSIEEVDAVSDINVAIPASFFHQGTDAESRRFTYEFSRFETEETLWFAPDREATGSREVQGRLDRWPPSVKVKVSDIDAGRYGGRRKEINLSCSNEDSMPQTSQSSTQDRLEGVTTCALGLVDVITAAGFEERHITRSSD